MNDFYIIGRGSYGVVYKVILVLGIFIVVKKIVVFDKSIKLIYKSFWREIEIIGYVKYWNFVRLFGFCKLGEVGFLLYDYVFNGDFYVVLYNKELGLVLNWRFRFCIVEGVVYGLVYFYYDYDFLIVYWDIKVSNVFLDDDLEVYILDFGIVKVFDMY